THPKGTSQKFSLKTGTIFEESPVSLDKWLVALWMVVNCKNGISSYEIHRALGVTQKTAWFMDHRIRLALHEGSFEKMGKDGSAVEVDETYIGGKSRNMHKSKCTHQRGGAGKQAVFGLLERNTAKGRSKIRLQTIPESWKNEALDIIRETVERGTAV